MRVKKPHIEPQIGLKINSLTILGFCRFNGKKGVICKCDCGNTIETLFSSVKYQLKTSCGCVYRLNLDGQRFGKLVVKQTLPSNNLGKTYVLCQCDCGVEKTLDASAVKRGSYQSCGCNRTPSTTKQYRNHPLYDVWKGMKARCKNKNHSSWDIYGGKGVQVCELWDNSFKSFYDWCIENGWKEGLQIDKDIIPNEMGIPALLYSPEYCKIVSRKENVRESEHTKLTIEIVKEIRSSNLKHSGLAKKYSVHISTIQRVKSNKLWL